MRKLPGILMVLLAGLLLAACQMSVDFLPGGPNAASSTHSPQTATAQATPTAAMTPAPVLAAKTLHEDSQSPKWTIDLRWPYLEWGSDPRISAFNQAAERFATEQAAKFKENAANLPNDPELNKYGSSLQIDFMPTNADHGILAVLFKITFYNAGAAHPGHFSYPINYDLREGKLLTLPDLFQPGADYLQAFSTDCLKDLKARGVLEWAEGAQPKAENYQVWNITPDGLLITFDEYQVASYAAGPQTVMLPYSQLSPLLRVDGPLQVLIKK